MEAICDGLYDVEIRKIICSTNAIESLNARYRRAERVRGHFPKRAGRAEMSLPDHPITRPHRQRQGTMGHEVEAGQMADGGLLLTRCG
jgi:Transposase, Mutator family